MIRVDSWYTGRLGDFQQPLVDALVADGRTDLRLVFAADSPRAAAMSKIDLPSIPTPSLRRSAAAALRFPTEVLATRRRLADWYRGDHRRLIHVTMMSPWDLLFLDIPDGRGATVLTTIHDAVLHKGEESRLNEWVIDRLVGRADHLVVLSDHAGDVLRRSIGGRKPVHVVAKGLIVDSSTPRPAKTAPRDGPLKLLFFGRIIEYKGLDLLLDALKILRAQGGPEVELTIAGSGSLAPYEQAIAELGDVRTHVGGWMSDEDRAAFFAAADVQVVPYRDTSVSGIVLTGMWAGMPTIATPLPAFAEHLKSGKNAIFSHDLSPAAIAEAIRTLALSPALFDTLAAGAHRRAVSMSAPVVAGLWYDLYRELAPA